MLTSFSQSNQDLFVSRIMKQKQNGYFLEIGSNDPITHNNTYKLEKEYNWSGIMVEYDRSFESIYPNIRPNSVYEINDARNVDYVDLLNKNNAPLNIDYLQIDLDVDNRSTLDTLLLLNNTIFDTYKFATITFEHDIYRGNYFDTQKISRVIFQNRGYILVFPDVKVFWENEYQSFEDWYVHPDLVDMDLINKIKTNESLNSDQIIKNILENL
jgi:hypothetical protein